MTIREAAERFLARTRIAVTGVSRRPRGHGSNAVYLRLRQRGHLVFAVNPRAVQVEGDPAYPDLKSIPGGVEAVVIGTRPELAEPVLRECAALGVKEVWLHRSIGRGSVSKELVALGRELGLTVIAGGCPLMFDPNGDFGHACMRVACTLFGVVPRTV